MTKEILHTDAAPAAIGPYSQAVRAAKTLYVSGQIGVDPKTGDFAGPDVESQARQALKNLLGILRKADVGYDSVVKTTVFLTDMGDFAAVNRIYAEAFSENPPARSCVAVAALPKGAKVEVEAVVDLS